MSNRSGQFAEGRNLLLRPSISISRPYHLLARPQPSRPKLLSESPTGSLSNRRTENRPKIRLPGPAATFVAQPKAVQGSPATA